MTTPSPYDSDYYLRGVETGKSNYQDYRWLPEQTLTHAIYVQRHLRITAEDTVLDVGCARGFFVKALRMMGVKSFGYDISEWAIENCDPDVKDFVSTTLNAEPLSYDWITLKDLCEHVELDELKSLIGKMSLAAKKGMLVVVPLSSYLGGRYVRDEDEKDSTHIHRWPLVEWITFLMENAPQFTVSGSFYIRGIKECCKSKAQSCGFLTLNRIS